MVLAGADGRAGDGTACCCCCCAACCWVAACTACAMVCGCEASIRTLLARARAREPTGSWAWRVGAWHVGFDHDFSLTPRVHTHTHTHAKVLVHTSNKRKPHSAGGGQGGRRADRQKTEEVPREQAGARRTAAGGRARSFHTRQTADALSLGAPSIACGHTPGPCSVALPHLLALLARLGSVPNSGGASCFGHGVLVGGARDHVRGMRPTSRTPRCHLLGYGARRRAGGPTTRRRPSAGPSSHASPHSPVTPLGGARATRCRLTCLRRLRTACAWTLCVCTVTYDVLYCTVCTVAVSVCPRAIPLRRRATPSEVPRSASWR